MEDKYEKLAERIEACNASPFVRRLLSRELAAGNYRSLAAFLVNLVQSGELNVLTWEELEELTPGSLSALGAQTNTGSGR